MTFIQEWTVRVLNEGVPPLPASLGRGQTVPVAVWRGERAGAVHFLRLWKNGQPDCETAIADRLPDGSWDEPHFSGGNAWVSDPLARPNDGWDGYPVVWPGVCGAGGVRVIRGAASRWSRRWRSSMGNGSGSCQSSRRAALSSSASKPRVQPWSERWMTAATPILEPPEA